MNEMTEIERAHMTEIINIGHARGLDDAGIAALLRTEADRLAPPAGTAVPATTSTPES